MAKKKKTGIPSFDDGSFDRATKYLENLSDMDILKQAESPNDEPSDNDKDKIISDAVYAIRALIGEGRNVNSLTDEDIAQQMGFYLENGGIVNSTTNFFTGKTSLKQIFNS